MDRDGKPTIKDVAREAGVSPATVSSVLNGKARVRRISLARETAVQYIADKLGYTANPDAAALRTAERTTMNGRWFARQVGYSEATISNALNGRGRVSRETRDLILSEAERLGYQPDSAARRLRSRVMKSKDSTNQL